MAASPTPSPAPPRPAPGGWDEHRTTEAERGAVPGVQRRHLPAAQRRRRRRRAARGRPVRARPRGRARRGRAPRRAARASGRRSRSSTRRAWWRRARSIPPRPACPRPRRSATTGSCTTSATRRRAGSSASDMQLALRNATVVVLGAGGLGSWTMAGLACAGVGRIVAVDDDTIELSNLNRQVLYRMSDIGRRKVDVAAEALRGLNPEIDFVPLASAGPGRRRRALRRRRRRLRGLHGGLAGARHRALGEPGLPRAGHPAHLRGPVPAAGPHRAHLRAGTDGLPRVPGASDPQGVPALRRAGRAPQERRAGGRDAGSAVRPDRVAARDGGDPLDHRDQRAGHARVAASSSTCATSRATGSRSSPTRTARSPAAASAIRSRQARMVACQPRASTPHAASRMR